MISGRHRRGPLALLAALGMCLAACGGTSSSLPPSITIATLPPAHPSGLHDPGTPLYGIPQETFNGNDADAPVVTTTTTTTPAPPTPVPLSADALFDTDSFTLQPAGKDQLKYVITRFAQYRCTHFSIDAYTDSQYNGPSGALSPAGKAYNQRLSENRAKAVAFYLLGQGIPQSVLGGVTGHGYDTANPDLNPDGTLNAPLAQKDRRVDILVSSAC